MSSRPFAHRVDFDTLKENGIDPIFWRKYRKRILNHHKRKPWHPSALNRPGKATLTFEHFLIFNILTGRDIFRGVEGKGEQIYFLSILKGNKHMAHPFQQHYYSIVRIHNFFKKATESVAWYKVSKWHYERLEREEQELFGIFIKHHMSFDWSKHRDPTYKFLNEQFKIIHDKFKKSLDNQYDYRV